jgi:hypothetical protein
MLRHLGHCCHFSFCASSSTPVHAFECSSHQQLRQCFLTMEQRTDLWPRVRRANAHQHRWRGGRPQQRRRSRRPGAAASRTPRTASCIQTTMQSSTCAASMITSTSCACASSRRTAATQLTAPVPTIGDSACNIRHAGNARVCECMMQIGRGARKVLHTLCSAGSTSRPSCRSWCPGP